MSLWGKMDKVVSSIGDVDKVVEKDEVRRGDRRSFWGEVDKVGYTWVLKGSETEKNTHLFC